MGKASAKVTKSTAIKAKNKINKAPKVAAPARNNSTYTTTINPDTCTCKAQAYRSRAAGCKHIKAMRASAVAPIAAPAAVAAPTVLVNPESGLQGKG